MCDASCVERNLTVFSFEIISGRRIERICDDRRVLGVSGKD